MVFRNDFDFIEGIAASQGTNFALAWQVDPEPILTTEMICLEWAHIYLALLTTPLRMPLSCSG